VGGLVLLLLGVRCKERVGEFKEELIEGLL
jgi:hypothetical protein